MIEKRKVKKSLETIKIPTKEKEKIFVYSCYSVDKNVKVLIHSTKEGNITLDSNLVFSYLCEAGKDYSFYKKEIASIFRELMKENNLTEDALIKISKEKKFPHYWANSRLEKEIPKNNNYSNRNTNYKNNDNYDNYKKANSIKPVYLLEVLEQLDYITVEDRTPNTSGEEFWKYTITNSFTNHSFKTSVKTKGFIENNNPTYKFDIFNDVYNSSKGYGSGAIGLISYLGSHGLFKDPLKGKENQENRKKRAVDFIIDNVYKYIDKNDLISNDYKNNNSKAYVDIANYSRFPFRRKGAESSIKNYLTKQRKISNELVDKLIKEEKLYGGYFSQNSFQDGHKLFFNQYFFELTNSNEQEAGAERFHLYEDHYNNLKVTKLNTSSVAGKAFKLKGDKAKITIFTEAIIDALSVYELLKIGGIDPDYFNIYSVQGCPHFNNWLKENIGIGFEINDDNIDDYGAIYKVEYQTEIKPLAPSKLEALKTTLSNTNFYFVETNNQRSKLISKNLEAIKEIAKIEIIKKEKREDFIDYNKYEQNSIFLDETNFESFLLENQLTIINKDGKSTLATKTVKEVKQRIEPSEITRIKEKINKNLGCESIALAFDNDAAGLKYVKVLKALEQYLGIKTYNMIPQNIKKDTDCNDILKKYHQLIEENKSLEAEKLVTDFITKVIPNYDIKKKQKNIQQKNKI